MNRPIGSKKGYLPSPCDSKGPLRAWRRACRKIREIENCGRRARIGAARLRSLSPGGAEHVDRLIDVHDFDEDVSAALVPGDDERVGVSRHGDALLARDDDGVQLHAAPAR